MIRTGGGGGGGESSLWRAEAEAAAAGGGERRFGDGFGATGVFVVVGGGGLAGAANAVVSANERRSTIFFLYPKTKALSRKSLRQVRRAPEALPRKRCGFRFRFRRRPAGTLESRRAPRPRRAPPTSRALRASDARTRTRRPSRPTLLAAWRPKRYPRGSSLAPFAPARASRRRKRSKRLARATSATPAKTRPPRGTRPRLLSLPSQDRNREKKPFLRCRCPPNDGVPRATARATSSTSLL